MSYDNETSEAERIAADTPALSGDVMDFGDGYRRIVRHAAVTRETWFRDDERHKFKYVVHIEADEPVKAILAGGGTCLVLPLEVSHWDWPPPEAQVFRNGVLVYDHGKPVP